MYLPIQTVEAILIARGFRVVHETQKKRAYQHADALPVYLNLQSKSGETALVVHPAAPMAQLRQAAVAFEVGPALFHSSNMKLFPKHVHTGVTPTRYGWGISFRSEAGVHACLDLLAAGAPSALASADAVAEPLVARPPEGLDVAVTAMARVGHDGFRAALLAYWAGCALTGLADPRLLRASHIKPWSVATPTERTDPFNGLLLAPHVDAAFDAGLISFDDQGQLLVSPRLQVDDARALGLTQGLALRQVDARHAGYLLYHREQVLLG